MNVSVEIRKRCSWSLRTYVAAIQPANATAAWPDGSPPRSGVPRPVHAFVASTANTVSTSATSVSCAGASRRRSSTSDERSAALSAKTR